MINSFVFDEKSRVLLCKLLVSLEVAVIILAKVITYHGLQYRKRLRLYTSLVEGYDAGALPIVLIVTGAIIMLTNFVAIVVTFSCMYPSLRYRMLVKMRIYHKVNLVLLLLTLVCIILCVVQQTLIQETFKNGIMSALQRYRSDPDVKENVDKLQMKFACCGNEEYTDWFQVSWIGSDFVDISRPEVEKRLKGGLYESDDVPFSCCNKAIKRPCVMYHVHDNIRNFNYVYQRDLTLYKDGCKSVLIQMADKLVLFIFYVCILLVFFQLCISILTQLFNTSAASAIVKHDPTAPGTGYLFESCYAAANRDAAESRQDAPAETSRILATPSRSVPLSMGRSRASQARPSALPLASAQRLPPSTAPNQPLLGTADDRRINMLENRPSLPNVDNLDANLTP